MTTATLFHDLLERARAVRIEDEVIRRGIKLTGRIDRCGPCPRCGGSDRFSVHIRKQVFFCRQCGGKGRGAVDFVMFVDGIDFADAIEVLTGERTPPSVMMRTRAEVSSNKDDETYEREQRRKAAWLWARRQPIKGTIGEKYLRGRGITCALPPTLSFLPGDEKYPPAMIAAFGFPDEPAPAMLGHLRGVGAVHLTRLLPDGSDRERGDKAKIMIGRSLGLPIVLAPPNDLHALAITEGIEDALTVHAATGLGAWAAGAAGRMPTIADVIPDYIESVSVYAHSDRAGHAGAHGLAVALARRGIEVIVEGL
jgi:putative DNA primase/helicase